MILIGVTTGYAFQPPRLAQLEYPRLQVKFHVVQPMVLQTFPPCSPEEIQGEGRNFPPTVVGGNKRGVLELNHNSSSSWLPRIVVPVVAVAVIAAATYLIYTRRGG